MIAGDEMWSYFLAGPISKIVITLCVLSIVFSVYSERKQIRMRRAEEEAKAS